MIWLLAGVVACGSPDRHGAGDAGGEDAGDGGPIVDTPARPDPPTLTPCPDGWREVVDADDSALVTCDPDPDPEPTCAADEALFPGSVACERIGTACPAGSWADDLPANAIHVLAGAPAGGDGSEAQPYATIAEAIAAADPGDVIGVSKGTFDEVLAVREGVTIRGACVAETIVASSIPSDVAATILVAGAGGVRIENLQVGGERFGIRVDESLDGAALDSVVVARATAVGIVVTGRGALEATSVVVRGTGARPGDQGWGFGIDAYLGARVTIDGGAIESNRAFGIIASDAGTEISLDRVRIADTQSELASGTYGEGVEVFAGAHLTIARGALVRNRGVALLAFDPGTVVEASDVFVAGTQPQEGDDFGGYGVEVQAGATATFERTTLAENRGVGVHATRDANVTLRDVVIRDTDVDLPASAAGFAIEVRAATGVVERVEAIRNARLGVHVGDGGTLAGTDLAVALTEPRGPIFNDGYGLQVVEGGTVDLVRAAFWRNRVVGVVAFRGGARATFEDLAVDDTQPAECAPDCAAALFGPGVAALDESAIEATRFRIAGSVICGIQIVGGGTMDLSNGEISGSPLGANVQTEGFDLDRIRDRVVYRDVDQPLDVTALPVPEVLQGL